MDRYVVIVACLLVATGVFGQDGADPSRIRNAQKTEQDALAKNDPKLLAEAYYLYGKAYFIAGDYSGSQRHFLKALTLLEPHGDSFELGRLHIWISDTEATRHRFEVALQHTGRAEGIFKRIGSDEGLLKAYRQLAEIGLMTSRKEPSKAAPIQEHIKLYETLAYQMKDTLAMAKASSLNGRFRALFNMSGATPALESALKVYRERGDENSTLTTLMELLNAYTASDQFKLAGQTLEEVKELYNKKRSWPFQVETMFTRASEFYYRKTSDWEKAYRSSVLTRLTERERLSHERDSIISRLNVEFETEKKEAELAAQRTELDLNRRNLRMQTGLILALAMLFAAAIVTGTIFYRLYRKNKRISAINASLVREQNHRVKNNLQVMASMLHLQSRRLSDEFARQVLTDSRLRVEYMAMVQQKLYEEEHLAGIDTERFIEELTDTVLAACGYSDVETILTIDAVSLPPDQIIPMGMILNELITNSCKYAFPYNASPELKISCIRIKKDRLRLEVSDNGAQNEEDLNGSGKKSSAVFPGMIQGGSFGMELINMQAGQLDATGQFSYRNGQASSGLVFTMEFTI